MEKCTRLPYTVALTNLCTVFQLIAKANLHLNPAKCSLFHRQTSFLGHVVSEREVSTDPAKVEAVEKWLSPMSTGEVCSFLGLASFYRRFIAEFANIAQPLHQLTEKGQRFTWLPASQNTVNHLHKDLITTPILAIPDSTKPFLLDTDASNDGVGAVLSQMSEDDERVVAYYSHTLHSKTLTSKPSIGQEQNT
ncbi:hypothetical protein AAFF_G00312240 [Aldrovandia affinis]|uniref:Reverse transcriptase/retrotransposon-derived protein RNase H-like domain-containing protein n=1 Tax=Aldrovandia affinis TaxID=143900 RepID=A0AAD7SPI6_9TELE|nr:hypothetical protein AAFF_G00312240 [Aldrovandia affinis]